MKQFIDTAGLYDNAYTSEEIVMGGRRIEDRLLAVDVPDGNTIKLEGWVAPLSKWIEIDSFAVSGIYNVRKVEKVRIVTSGTVTTSGATKAAIEVA